MKPSLRQEGFGGNGNTRARQLAARREQLIAVAEQLFLQHGFANTSVNAIVREAGGSLATLYAEFGSKESLFESVLSERAARFFPDERSAPTRTLDARTELRTLATQMLKRMLSDDGLAVYRLAVHEAPRFPALRKALLEVGMPGLLERTARYLQTLADRSVLTIENYAGSDAARSEPIHRAGAGSGRLQCGVWRHDKCARADDACERRGRSVSEDV